MTTVHSSGPAPGSRPITDKEFGLFQDLVHREAGIYLGEAKRTLLVGRLNRRLRDLGLDTFASYYRRVEADPAERVRMLDALSTNETHFFREPHHFEFLEQKALPLWLAEAAQGERARKIRAWSAGCSTGEEPYTLAMTLLRALPPSSGWEIEILATDLSTRALARARDGLWPLAKSQEIPLPFLKAFMLKGSGPQEGKMRAGPEIRACVRFGRLNLNDDSYPTIGRFDLIFCRNVLIYFRGESRLLIIRRLLDRLSPTGYFFLGHAESLNDLGEPLYHIERTVYAFSEAAGRPASLRR